MSNGAVVTAGVLADGLRSHRADLRIEMIRNGVDAQNFRSRGLAAARPTDLPSEGCHIVGFVGALYEWIDWDLIAQASRAIPEAQFVFVGPNNCPTAIKSLEESPNVRFLGPRAYESIPGYVAAFDTCWVPFKTGQITAAANPVKIYEYLALGKPVVSTSVADPESFESLVSVGNNQDEVIAHLRNNINSTVGDTNARVEFAYRNSWDSRASQFSEFIQKVRC